MKNFNSFFKKYKKGQKLVLSTAYDYPIAKILDDSQVIDAILVGDSASNVIYGNDTTLPITFEQMLNHVKMVTKATEKTPVIADMPFLSYGISIEDSIKNCGLMIKEGFANAIKIEGGKEQADLVKKLVDLGIPVQGHIGLKPQHFYVLGGYKIAGKNEKEAENLIEDAKALEKAGAFSIILELITEEVAKKITESINIPTIGIGSGKFVDGQIVVINDILGLGGYVPSFIKKYADLNKIISDAVKNYASEVINEKFPEKSFHMEKK